MIGLALVAGGLWVVGKWTEAPAMEWLLPGFFVGTVAVLWMAHRTAQLVAGVG